MVKNDKTTFLVYNTLVRRIYAFQPEPPPSSATSLLDLHILWFQFSSAAEYLMLFTAFHTLVFILLGGWSPGHLSGLVSPETSLPGPGPALNVGGVKFSSTFILLFHRFLFLPAGSSTSTWTLWGLYLVPEVSPTSSPSLTGSHVGLRLFLWPPSLLLIVPGLSSLLGSQDLGFQLR